MASSNNSKMEMSKIKEKTTTARFKALLMKDESPFKWQIPETTDITQENFIKIKQEKCNNLEEETEFQWSRFTISLIISYEVSKKMKDHRRALDTLKWCKEHLTQLEKSGCEEPLFELFPLLKHVVAVTEAIILLESNQVYKAFQVAIQWGLMSSSPDNINTAHLLGLKAAVYLQYGIAGHRLALKAARKAKDLDPTMAEWWYLISNALGRIRRIENACISEEEIKAAKKAAKLTRNASYIVHLAQLYKEYSSFLYFEREKDKSVLYSKKAESKYMEAIELRPNCLTLKARVAHGMLRNGNIRTRNITFVKELLKEIVEKNSTCAMAFHDLGYYYEKFGSNTRKAIICLKKSNAIGNIRALTYLLSIKWKNGLESEIIEDIKEALTRYKSEEAQAQLLAILGASIALLEDNWVAAVECFQKSLNVDPSAKYLEDFYDFNYKKVNLLGLVANHLHEQKIRSKDDTFKPFLDFVRKVRPKMIHENVGVKRYRFREWKKDLFKVIKPNTSLAKPRNLEKK